MTADRQFRVRNTTPSDARAIISLSAAIYPADIYTEAQIARQCDRFAAGQFVAVTDGESIVGMSSCMLLGQESVTDSESWNQITSVGTLARHLPGGDMVYGVETMVHPDWQHRGVGTVLVKQRVELATRLGAKSIRTGIRLSGYGQVADILSPQQYVRLVLSRRITDQALSFMLKFGFSVRAVVEGYLERDPDSRGCAAILERRL